MNSAINTKKQPWGPFIKQVLGPNVPWAWYLGNLIARLSLANVMVAGYKLSGQIMSGEAVSDTAILWKYAGLMALSMGVTVAFTVSNSWAGYWTERKLQTRLWTKMIRMPMRLYDQQDPLSLISRVTEDTMLVTYSMSYLFTFLGVLVAQLEVGVLVGGGFDQGDAGQPLGHKAGQFGHLLPHHLLGGELEPARDDHRGPDVGQYQQQGQGDAAVHPPDLLQHQGQGVHRVEEREQIAHGVGDQHGVLRHAAVFAMRSTIYNYMLQFVFCFHYIKDAQGSTAKIAELMTFQPEVLARERSFTQPEDDIAFENVSFRYDDKDVIQNVSVIIPKGKVTAIVGPSGAGKTTLLSLLERLYTRRRASRPAVRCPCRSRRAAP